MSNLETLEAKINHVDKKITHVDVTIKHLAEKLAENVKQNSIALTNHDNRISDLERSFHVYDGSIKTLNRLLTLCSAGILSGVIWLFAQINEYKRDYVIMHSQQEQVIKELNTIRHDVERMKYDRITKPTDTNEYN